MSNIWFRNKEREVIISNDFIEFLVVNAYSLASYYSFWNQFIFLISHHSHSIFFRCDLNWTYSLIIKGWIYYISIQPLYHLFFLPSPSCYDWVFSNAQLMVCNCHLLRAYACKLKDLFLWYQLLTTPMQVCIPIELSTAFLLHQE